MCPLKVDEAEIRVAEKEHLMDIAIAAENMAIGWHSAG